MPDYRSTFGHYTCKKPVSWEKIPVVKWANLNDFEKNALAQLPTKLAGKQPMDDNFPDCLIDKNAPVEFLVRRLENDALYYVNTEGYSYMRYAFGISGAPENIGTVAT